MARFKGLAPILASEYFLYYYCTGKRARGAFSIREYDAVRVLPELQHTGARNGFIEKRTVLLQLGDLPAGLYLQKVPFVLVIFQLQI